MQFQVFLKTDCIYALPDMDALCVTGLAAGLFSVVVSNGVLFIVSLFQRHTFRDRFTFRSLFYRDQDGEATDLSLRKVGGKWSCRAILFASFSGLVLASATVSVVLMRGVGYTHYGDMLMAFLWCQFGSWVRRGSAFFSNGFNSLVRFWRFFNRHCCPRRLHTTPGFCLRPVGSGLA